MFVIGLHPAELSILTCLSWWFLRMLYLIFIEGFGEDPMLTETLRYEHVNYLASKPVSIWISLLPSWLIFGNFVMGLIPIPAILASCIKRKDQSEEFMFVLAAISLIPLIGAQANCIRFFGGFATVYASWRCYQIGLRSNMSERII